MRSCERPHAPSRVMTLPKAGPGLAPRLLIEGTGGAFPLSQERKSEAATETTTNLIYAFRKFWIGQNIRNVNGLARQYGSSRDGPPVSLQETLRPKTRRPSHSEEMSLPPCSGVGSAHFCAPEGSTAKIRPCQNNKREDRCIQTGDHRVNPE